MDDTYKVIHEGYSVTVMGQSDADRVFHVRAVGVSTNSDERVGRFYLNAWKARVPEFSPRAYLGDAAQAYANAAMAIRTCLQGTFDWTERDVIFIFRDFIILPPNKIKNNNFINSLF